MEGAAGRGGAPPLPRRVGNGVGDAVAPPRRSLPAPSRQRRAPTPGQMARRAFLLRWTRRILPVLGVALLVAIPLWSELERGGRLTGIGMRIRPDAMRVENPRYQGTDEENRPFTVTAQAATQGAEDDVLMLDAPRADILLDDGKAWVLLEARSGRYDKARNHLDLEGGVTLFHDNGTMLETDRAAIALGDGAASGDAPVAVQGPFGTLTGEGFRLTDRGAVVAVTGRSRAVLEGDKAE